MTSQPSGSSSFDLLDERIRRWIWRQQWPELRIGQELSIPAILKGGKDVILAAPTASGKTEAAFFPILTHMLRTPSPSVRTLYISPLKALINDQFNRLDLLCDELDVPVHRWHGDVTESAKERLLKQPQGVLLITPESLEALFMSRGATLAKTFAHLAFVVIDELHSFMGTERGAQLQSLLSRLEDLVGHRPVRVGLSATLAEMGMAAEFLRSRDPANVELLEVAGSGELKAQIRAFTYGSPSGTEELVTDADELIMDDLYALLTSEHHLIFANSRNRVETFTDGLRTRAERNGSPDIYLAHHGNLSKELREFAEERLRTPEQSAVCVCTSTLELGIDIGAMTSIAQIGPPPSVASLRQRIGRSGRRGSASALRMYASEPAVADPKQPLERLHLELVQEIAAVELIKAKWCEPPTPDQPHFSTLVQQVLSHVVERGGCTIPDLLRRLCSQGAFRSVSSHEFVTLLRAMKAKQLLQQMDDGTILLDAKGERITSHYSFYAAFATPEEYRLLTGSRVLGTIPVESVLRPGDHLLFAGKRWRVRDVDDEARVLLVEPSRGGKAPIFGGSPGVVHRKVREEMRCVLSTPDLHLPYLNRTGVDLLSKARHAYDALELRQRSLLELGTESLLFHWSGDGESLALALLLQQHGVAAELQGVAIKAEGGAEAIRAALRAILEGEKPLPEALASLVKLKRVNKYDWVVPEELLNKEFAARELCVNGALQIAALILGESPAVRQPSPTRQHDDARATRLRVLDGGESIGGTKLLLSEGGEDVLLDFGLEFKKYGTYFEEFLRPRSTRGLVDLWQFGLIPHLQNAFREDLVPLGSTFDGGTSVNLAGIFLSHAHVDHYGMIGTLRRDVPLHASGESLAIIKASQDSGRLDFWGEATYLKERQAAKADPRALVANGRRLARDLVCIGELPIVLASFLQSSPSEQSDFVAGHVSSSTGTLGPFKYQTWNVDHSLPGCLAMCIETSRGRIAYTGDLRFHGTGGALSRAFVEEMALNPPDLLICEGTQVARALPNTTSEEEVSQRAFDIVRESTGQLVIADFGPRHVERLSTFLSIAAATDRRLVLTTKDVYLLEALALANSATALVSSTRIVIYDEVRGSINVWESDIRERYRDRLVDAVELSRHPGWYLLAFSFFDCNELIDINPVSATYIYSGSEAYSEEQVIDLTRLTAWCQRFNITIHGFKQAPEGFDFSDGLNASGHATRDDLQWLIQTVRPKMLMPIHRASEAAPWFSKTCAEMDIKVVTAADVLL